MSLFEKKKKKKKKKQKKKKQTKTKNKRRAIAKVGYFSRRKKRLLQEMENVMESKSLEKNPGRQEVLEELKRSAFFREFLDIPTKCVATTERFFKFRL